jgi:hypothetical protein
MNPTAFEYRSSYLAFMATELHTNRFWEFVQSQAQDEAAPDLPSVFSSEFRLAHKSKVYESLTDKPLQFNPRHLIYWQEYFGRFDKPVAAN